MDNPLCSQAIKSSSPVPYVGLYIAGATLVCLLLILCDLFFSILHKKPYLPCKFFSLNSATLTLLAIASKLPVDLTTNMPSASDQLSKLAGTSIVCVSMAFMMPSLGTNRDSENITNVIALSLFVVTTVVNICIQLRTGVIYSFSGEHIVILCCMMMILVVFWFSTSLANILKAYITEENREAFIMMKEERELMHQVRLWYSRSCVNNPQFALCTDAFSITSSGMICIICSIVLSQAAIRSIVLGKLEFCDEHVSEYRWSIPMILATQIITVVVASLATTCRWFMMLTHAEITDFASENYTNETETFAFRFLRRLRRRPMKNITYLSLRLVKAMKSLIYYLVYFTVVWVPHSLYTLIIMCVIERDGRNFGFWLSETIENICKEDMNKWMHEIYSRSIPNGLVVLEVLQGFELTSWSRFIQFGTQISQRSYKVSCLTVVILARFIVVSMPCTRSKPLIQALDEAFEMLYYVDQKTNIEKFGEMKRNLSRIMFENIEECVSDVADLMNYHDAMRNIRDELRILDAGSRLVGREGNLIIKYLEEDAVATDVHVGIRTKLEQLFICMLRFFLRQLRGVIAKDVNESPIEEHEERALVAFKLVCKFKFLQDRVPIFQNME